ncbi:MAG: DUF3341 domain-containing protein [Myxococcaceae bacterium]|nr:DUF3341 domain-containing protein [Myxococcaceae bacterium]
MTPPAALHVVLGELASPRALLDAVTTLRGEHVRQLDTHTPYPVNGLDEALGLSRSTVAWWAFAGGCACALAGAALQLPGTSVVAVALLSAALTGVVALGVMLSGRQHPAFAHPLFVLSASSSGFWVSVSTRIAEDAERAKTRLEALGATNVTIVVEHEAPHT